MQNHIHTPRFIHWKQMESQMLGRYYEYDTRAILPANAEQIRRCYTVGTRKFSVSKLRRLRPPFNQKAPTIAYRQLKNYYCRPVV